MKIRGGREGGEGGGRRGKGVGVDGGDEKMKKRFEIVKFKEKMIILNANRGG